MKTKILLAAGLAALGLAAAGCVPSSKSGRGFHMPSGNADNGKAAFVALKCVECHRVEGVELAGPTEPRETLLVLGGEVTHVRTYGELVTAIIHPTRNISLTPVAEGSQPVTKTTMKSVNAEMTVQQLIDIVTFLEPTYRHVPPEYSGPAME